MRRLLPVALFAVAFAYCEASVVVYLRKIVGVVEPWTDASVYDAAIGAVEFGREAATLVLLAALGWACGRNAQTRFGFALFAFGIWDILYYFWLKILIGWPASLLTPDILFLIPLPWWGPVVTPILIAVLLAAAGAAAIVRDERGRTVRIGPLDGSMMAAGVALMLWAFMADAIAVLPASAETLSQVRPGAFSWGRYAAGLLLLGIGIARPLAAAGPERASRARAPQVKS